MAEFNIFKLWRRWRRFGAIRPSKMSRVNYLLWLSYDRLEEPNRTFGGLNFLQLVEKQIEDGQFINAAHSFHTQVRSCFRMANLYWGDGDIVTAEIYLRKTLERHARLTDLCRDNNLPPRVYHEFQFVKCAACLLGEEIPDSLLVEELETGYEPWFQDTLLNYCVGSSDFDMNPWQASVDQWLKRGLPKYRIEEFAFYVKALTGAFGSTDEMFTAHQRLIKERAKRNPDASLLDGYDEYSTLVIDYIFAAILKRIG